MREGVRHALVGLLSGSGAVAFVALFVLCRTGVAPPWLAFALLGGGIAAVLVAVGVEGAATIPQPDDRWWLARVEAVLEDAWNGYADAALFGGLVALGVVALAILAADPAADEALGLLVVAFLSLNGAFFAFVAARY
ncbi:hypothetical protein [Halapricum desulfuricans]|uniref:Putative membrane protein n=1 Tax=Halapricum desulfuricans TaxID=2841257 RepID=A0A897N5C1_9EURY|nr:hypothetical protein [Halapricum desulfuricans]QSG06259.1 putative membrane protein [Halapricum desulfuricans]